MTSSKPTFSSSAFTQRRRLLITSALGLGSSLLPSVLSAQVPVDEELAPASSAEVQAIIDDLLDGKTANRTGLTLAMPTLGDNPAAVPVKVIFEDDINIDYYCKELIVLAEGNPMPLACRLHFSALSGTTEVALRLRLIDSQPIHAFARMSDGSMLTAKQHITVTAGSCGM